MNLAARCLTALVLGVASFACREAEPPPSSEYPLPVDLSLVGTYAPLSKSGGGYFYDDVLEYRVWVHPIDGEDNFHAFSTFEQAREFSRRTPRAEEPLVLVRQREWIDEPEPGVFEHKKGERITEWRVEWLEGSRWEADSIPRFLEAPPAGK